MRKTVATALTVAALATGTGIAAASSTDEVMVDPYQVTAGCWFDLMDAGYIGRPDDGREALYVPADQLANVCGGF